MNGHIDGVVDFHQHAMPLPVLDWLASNGAADLDTLDAGFVRIDPAVSGVPPGAQIPVPQSQYDARVRIAELNEMEVGRACVSLPPFLIATEHSDPEFVESLITIGNHALIEWCEGSGGRLVPLPSVPLGLDTYDAATWSKLALDGHVGIALGTGGLSSELDDPRHDAIWSMLSDTGMFGFVHPSRASSPSRHAKYWLTQLVGYPAETALATSRLILSGALDRYDFKLVLAHGGGCLPSLAGRLDLGWRTKEQTRTVDEAPTAYLQRMYYDSATFSPDVLNYVISIVGHDRIVAGTDWPFDLSDPKPVESLKSAGGSDLVASSRRATAELMAGSRQGRHQS